MEWKRIIPILAIVAIMGVFMGAMHPASAASTTEVKAYTYDPYDPPGTELGKELTIKKGEYLDIAATLHVDGGNPQWFRYIHYYVYNSNGDQIVNEERNSGFGGVARCWINSKNWDAGTYKLCITYWGSDDGDYPRADKNVIVHIK